MNNIEDNREKGKELLNLIAGSSMSYNDKVEAAELFLAIEVNYNKMFEEILNKLRDLKTLANANKR